MKITVDITDRSQLGAITFMSGPEYKTVELELLPSALRWEAAGELRALFGDHGAAT